MSPSNRYQLLPLSSFPSLAKLPGVSRKKHHHPSVPRPLFLVALAIPLVVIGSLLYWLALITNAFRIYEANPPTFAAPFRGTGADVESLVPEFPHWVTTDWESVEATVWSVKTELTRRFVEMGLPESKVGCPTIISNIAQEPSFLQARYSHLLPPSPSNPHTSPYFPPETPQGFFFALNLFNSKDIIPHLFNTLLAVAALLGPSNVHIAVYENGSWDETKLAMAHFARALSALGVAHSLRHDDHETDWANVDRIEQLAIYRNIALAPLLEYAPANPPIFSDARVTNATGPHPKVPTDLLFVNDVYVCPTDILELLHQRRFQGASATCGLDWREAPQGTMWGWLKGWLGTNYRFYDNWVTRSMEGFPLRPRVDMFGELRDGVRELFHWDTSPTSLIRYRAGLPLPVYSCWNGLIALTAAPFLPRSTAPTPHGQGAGHGIRFRHGDMAHGECAASECKLVARDFWGVGEKKWVLVPRVAVTYEEEGYASAYVTDRVRRGGAEAMVHELEEGRWTRKGWDEAMELEERIDWSKVKDPEKVVCFPFHKGSRLEIWPFYMEGTSVNSSILHNFNQTSSHVPFEDIGWS